MDRVHGGREGRVCERRRELRLGGADRPAVPKLQLASAHSQLSSQLPFRLPAALLLLPALCLFLFIYLGIILFSSRSKTRPEISPRAALLEMPLPPCHVG